MDAVRATARDLRAEAAATNERRLLVLAGGRERGYDAARAACEATACDAVSLSERGVVGDRLPLRRADELLGTTRDCVVVDCHDETRPNALGRAAGAVDGGGLLVLVTPPLDAWPDRRDGFDESLAVPPFGLEGVAGNFRARLVRTLREHRGVGIVDVRNSSSTNSAAHQKSKISEDVDDGAVIDDGLTHPAPRIAHGGIVDPPLFQFPPAVYDACLTADQRDAVFACERLREEGRAVVLEADRGRGKSSAAGLAAAALAAEGDDVLVTAPNFRNAAEVFDRAAETLDALGELAADTREADVPSELRSRAGGRIYYRRPTKAVEESADVLVVDEAAALPVRVLESLLEVAPSACFATTVHGYEGAGRGFDVRFRGHLDDARDVETVTLAEPIRYAAADPVEVWLFRALLLDARPAVDPLVEGREPADASYERLEPVALADDENRLREAFGLLVEAHYRTEPNDLARLLDAPNVAVRALTVDGHVAAVALLAREGGLPAELRREMYEGSRVRGNMLPDVLTSQLRDPEAAVPVGLRVMRIATHSAVRSRGFGSRLLADVEAEFDPGTDRTVEGRFDAVDYLGVGYGATPELLSFWEDNGYATVHLSTTRNDASGEYSAVMLRALSEAGADLADRHMAWFRRRVPGVLADALDDADPDVVRAALTAARGPVPLDLSDLEWRLVSSAAYGPGLFDIAPDPFRRLALRALVDGALADADVPDPDAERLLVAKVLQARPWGEVVEELGYVSRRECMRALGDAYRPLVDRYGSGVAREEAERYDP